MKVRSLDFRVLAALEHRFHRFLKRTMALEGLFGSADEIVLDVGRRLLATRHVPTLIEL